MVFTTTSRDTHWLLLLCAARVGASVMYMAYPTILSVVQREWSLSAVAAGSISSAFQLGTAVSLVVLSLLADRLGARTVFAWSGAAAALFSLLLPLFARDYLSALFLFVVVAVSLSGTYTPGLMLISARFPAGRRGWAIGWFLAAGSLGYALALLVGGVVVTLAGWRAALLAMAAGPVLCALLAAWVLRGTTGGPGAAPGGFGLGRELSGNRAARLMITGYTFHSWELLGMWAWSPAFMAAVLGAQGLEIGRSAGIGANFTALFHVMGMAASGLGGWLSDRWGRTGVIILMMAVSTACSFTFGWLLTAPLALVVLVGLLYGFSALGDSPVYSTGITEVVKPGHLGGVLAVRSLLGFGAGAVAPLVFGLVLDITGGGSPSAGRSAWGWAFGVLGIGGFLGLLSMVRLRALPESRKLAGGKR